MRPTTVPRRHGGRNRMTYASYSRSPETRPAFLNSEANVSSVIISVTSAEISLYNVFSAGSASSSMARLIPPLSRRRGIPTSRCACCHPRTSGPLQDGRRNAPPVRTDREVAPTSNALRWKTAVFGYFPTKSSRFEDETGSRFPAISGYLRQT